jgi:hypothetical protein
MGRADLMQDPEREQLAKVLCHSCVGMYACREWAVRNDVDGVCGGLTPAERDEWRRCAGIQPRRIPTHLPVQVLVEDDRRRHGTNPEILAGVAQLSRSRSAAEVADLIGVSQRQVVRFLAQVSA